MRYQIITTLRDSADDPKVLIPHVEHARVIIMEHIQPGMNLETWCRRYRGMEDEDCQRKINSELPKIVCPPCSKLHS